MHRFHQKILTDMNLKKANRYDVERWQIYQFKEQLRYARSKSSFYANVFSMIDIDSIQTFDDISQLPFVTAEQVSEFGQQMLCVSMRHIERIRTLPTSGTTGKPKRIYFTSKDLQRTIDFFALGMLPMIHMDRSVAILMGNSREFSIADLLQRGLQNNGISSFIISQNSSFDSLCTLLLEQNPYCIVGIPAQIFYLCRALPTLKPSTVLLSADYISPSLIATIEREWACDVLTHYGLTESTYGLAVQGLDKRYQSIRSSEFLLEIIDPETGECLPNGSEGEIVLSTLQNEAMPLIRYRTGDISSLHWSNTKEGTPLPMLGFVHGRYVNLQKNTNIYQLDDILYQLPFIRAYQAHWQGEELLLTIDGSFSIADDVWKAVVPTICFEEKKINPFLETQKQIIHEEGTYGK